MALVAHAIPAQIALNMFLNGTDVPMNFQRAAGSTGCRQVNSPSPSCTGTESSTASTLQQTLQPWLSWMPGRNAGIQPLPCRHGYRPQRKAATDDANPSRRAWPNAYELSQDLREKQLEALARRYGGAVRAGQAAAVIQHAYRRHCMVKNFAKLRLEADERWRRRRPLSDFSRSQTVWSDMATAIASYGTQYEQTVTNIAMTTTATKFSVDLSCISEYDVMSHSYSADNMLQQCATLTRTSRHVTMETSSIVGAAEVLDDDRENSELREVAATAAACPPPYLSSGDSSDGSARASPVTGVDPTSADFETVLEATGDSDDDSFNSTDDEEPFSGADLMASESLTPVQPQSTADWSIEVPAYGATVRLRRKKVLPTDVPAVADSPDTLWQRKSSVGSCSDSSSTRQLSETLETSSMDSMECLALMADLCKGNSVGTLPRFPSSVAGTATTGMAGAQPRQQLQPRLSDKLRKRTYRIGLNLFNKKPENGIRYLVGRQFLEERPTSVARFLITRKGLSKQMIGEYLGNLQRPFNMEVLGCFCDQIDLTGLQIDVALRKFQSYFRMPGEAQKIERLMEAFASRYCRCNAEEVQNFVSTDTVFLLAFAVIMLNTDLHNASIKPERKMKLTDFIRNLRGIDGGCDVNVYLLTGIYERVRDVEFKPGTDHVSQVVRIEQMIIGKKPPLAIPCRRLVCYCRLCEVPDISKREKVDRHQREIFLFNDMLLITKIINKKKTAAYSFRQSFPLCGMMVYLYDTPHYRFGIRLATNVDGKVLINLNARSENDRNKFVEDLKEAILEMNDMETLRIDEELKKQKVPPNPVNVNRYSKDSGVVDIELLKLADGGGCHRLSAPECERLKKSTLSNSLIDISEGSRRASGGSLDSGMASAESGSTHSCCQHDLTAAGMSSKLPHYLRTLQPPLSGLTVPAASRGPTPRPLQSIDAPCHLAL